MCVAFAVAVVGASRPGQAVCVVPGRSGFGRGLAHWSAMDGERQPGAVCWEPCGCVEWFGTAPRKGRPRESPRNSSRTGSPRNSTRLSSSAAAGGVVNQCGAPSCGKSLHICLALACAACSAADFRGGGTKLRTSLLTHTYTTRNQVTRAPLAHSSRERLCLRKPVLSSRLRFR